MNEYDIRSKHGYFLRKSKVNTGIYKNKNE